MSAPRGADNASPGDVSSERGLAARPSRARRAPRGRTIGSSRCPWRSVHAAPVVARPTRLAVLIPGARIADSRRHSSPVSLRGAERRSNPLPDEPRNAGQAGDCFVALLLARTKTSPSLKGRRSAFPTPDDPYRFIQGGSAADRWSPRNDTEDRTHRTLIFRAPGIRALRNNSWETARARHDHRSADPDRPAADPAERGVRHERAGPGLGPPRPPGGAGAQGRRRRRHGTPARRGPAALPAHRAGRHHPGQRVHRRVRRRADRRAPGDTG